MPRIRSHPGEILQEEYLKPLGMSARALAEAIGIPANRLTEIVRERRGVTNDLRDQIVSPRAGYSA